MLEFTSNIKIGATSETWRFDLFTMKPNQQREKKVRKNANLLNQNEDS